MVGCNQCSSSDRVFLVKKSQFGLISEKETNKRILNQTVPFQKLQSALLPEHNEHKLRLKTIRIGMKLYWPETSDYSGANWPVVFVSIKWITYILTSFFTYEWASFRWVQSVPFSRLSSHWCVTFVFRWLRKQTNITPVHPLIRSAVQPTPKSSSWG